MTRRDLVFAQMFSAGVRCLHAAIQATGPAVLLPEIERGSYRDGDGTTQFETLSEVENRREVWARSMRHLDFMQECVDTIGSKVEDEY